MLTAPRKIAVLVVMKPLILPAHADGLSISSTGASLRIDMTSYLSARTQLSAKIRHHTHLAGRAALLASAQAAR